MRLRERGCYRVGWSVVGVWSFWVLVFFFEYGGGVDVRGVKGVWRVFVGFRVRVGVL